MKSSEDLRSRLRSIDHRSYPAYKDLKGLYVFGNYSLSIDHVQGDPFAAPSRLSVIVPAKRAAFPAEYYDMLPKRVTLQDHLTRLFGAQIARGSKQAGGSGKSGLLAVSRCGQEVLERTACALDPEHGDLLLRLEVGFPANGRTITVNGNATGDKDSAKTDEEVVVTLTPKEGYTITSVDCNVTAKIDTKNWTVTIPAGLENVVIDVDTDPDVYTVTYDETSEWWSGRHMIKTSGETTIERDGSITVELTTDFIGATNAQVKVTGATGEFTKVNGVDQKTDSTTISTEAELKVLQNQFGTIYSDAACENPVAGAVTPSMTVYWITVEGQAAVWTGTISNPTGNVTVELDV